MHGASRGSALADATTFGGFPGTHWSVIREAADRGSPDRRESLERLAQSYWRPVYAYFRRKWRKSDEEAKDLTQEFFAAMCEKDFLQRLSPDAGRFRSYVMAALNNFALQEYRQRSALKRGGGLRHFSLQFEEGFEPAGEGSPEQAFQREWARTLLGSALDDFRTECRDAGREFLFDLLMLRDVNPPAEEDVSYEALARRFRITTADVSNHLTRSRRRLREILLQRIQDTVQTEAEAFAEMMELFGGREA